MYHIVALVRGYLSVSKKMYRCSPNYISTCHCHLSSRFLIHFFEDSPVVAFLFLLDLFFSIFSLERLSLWTAGFSVRSKHFSKCSMSLCGPVKIYSHGISMPKPPPCLISVRYTCYCSITLLFYYITVWKLYYSLPYVFGIVQLVL